jgi:hypothetical protein
VRSTDHLKFLVMYFTLCQQVDMVIYHTAMRTPNLEIVLLMWV